MEWTDNLVGWTKQVAAKYDLHLGQRLGQNFLVNKDILKAVVESADLNPSDMVLEVGAGIGTLTLALLEKSVHLVSVEYDRKLIPILRKIIDTNDKFKILEGDILKISDETLSTALGGQKNFKIVANLPYEITGAFLKRFLAGNLKPSLMILMLQKEVGERLLAQAGQMNLLALQAQLYTRVEIVRKVSKQCFFPPPDVESVIVKFSVVQLNDLRKNISIEEEKAFWSLARAGFAHKRKYLLSNLVGILGKDKDFVKKAFIDAGLKQDTRAQALSLEKWLQLAKIWFKG